MSIKHVAVDCAESSADSMELSFHDKEQQVDGLICGFSTRGSHSITLNLREAKRIRDALNECIALYE